eukprot:COSAG02_NODE_28094_length_596_cov_1.340040_1_plen_64_part_10
MLQRVEDRNVVQIVDVRLQSSPESCTAHWDRSQHTARSRAWNRQAAQSHFCILASFTCSGSRGV